MVYESLVDFEMAYRVFEQSLIQSFLELTLNS